MEFPLSQKGLTLFQLVSKGVLTKVKSFLDRRTSQRLQTVLCFFEMELIFNALDRFLSKKFL